MASARTRHQRREGGEVWGGGVHLPTGGGVWGGGDYATSLKTFRFLELKVASFGACWEPIILQLNCMFYTHKPVSLDFGL